MAKSLSMAQMKQLAAYGARARLAELRAEIAAITRAFPEVAGATVAAVTRRRRRRPTEGRRVFRRCSRWPASTHDVGRRSCRHLGGAEETLGGHQEEEGGGRVLSRGLVRIHSGRASAVFARTLDSIAPEQDPLAMTGGSLDVVEILTDVHAASSSAPRTVS